MILSDYHLIFIIISFLMLFLEIYYIFVEGDKQSVIGGAILAAINWVICLINYMGFFGVGLPGVDSSGDVTVTTYSGMHSYFVLFFAMQWINLIFVLYCWYKWMHFAHVDTEPEGSDRV